MKRIIIIITFLLLITSCQSNQSTNNTSQVQYSVEQKYSELVNDGYFTQYDEESDLMMIYGDPDSIHHYFVYDFDNEEDNHIVLHVLYGDEKHFIVTILDDEYVAFDDYIYYYNGGIGYDFDGKEVVFDDELKSLFQKSLELYKDMENRFQTTSMDKYMNDVKETYFNKGKDYLLEEAAKNQ